MAYEPREINATRGRASFSDMVDAIRKRQNLATALTGGIESYQQAKNFSVKNALAQAEAKKNQAEAGFYGRKESLVDINTLPEELQKSAAASVQIDPVTGQRGIPVSAMKSLYENQGSDLKQQLADTASKAQQALAKKDQDIAAVQQQLADEKTAHGKAAITAEGLRTVATEGAKAKPSLANEIAATVSKHTAPGGFIHSLAEPIARPALQAEAGLSAMTKLNSPSDSNGVSHTNAPLTPSASFTPAPPSPLKPTVSNAQYPLGGADPTKMPPAQVGMIPDTIGTKMPTQPVDTGTPQPQSMSPQTVAGQKPVAVYTQEDYDALPDGTPYVDSEGQKIKGAK